MSSAAGNPGCRKSRHAVERGTSRLKPHRGGGLPVGEADGFPGHHTLHTLCSGKITGTLSAKASTGAAWDHVRYGTRIATSEHRHARNAVGKRTRRPGRRHDAGRPPS
ncbi:hypothetical protein [Streptomyces sp. bgisy060]|uniref:hypothetical protein n=1 Tax=Streptomyces sp. bgisy060 TaxID=3413775 RepID=UPI003EB9EE45